MFTFALLALAMPSGKTLAIGAGAAVVALLAYKVDSKIEGIKEHALELKGHADRLGLSFMSDFLGKFAIGDKSGMIAAVVGAVKTMRDEDHRLEVVRRVAKASLQLLFERATEHEWLVKYIEQLKLIHVKPPAETKAAA